MFSSFMQACPFPPFLIIWQICRMSWIMVLRSLLKLQCCRLNQEHPYLLIHLVLLQLLDKDCDLVIPITKRKTPFSQTPSPVLFVGLFSTIIWLMGVPIRITLTDKETVRTLVTLAGTLIHQALTTPQWICMQIARAMILRTEILVEFRSPRVNTLVQKKVVLTMNAMFHRKRVVWMDRVVVLVVLDSFHVDIYVVFLPFLFTLILSMSKIMKCSLIVLSLRLYLVSWKWFGYGVDFFFSCSLRLHYGLNMLYVIVLQI